MSDEEDYMSDALLEKCGDSRPGLISKSVAKQYQKQQSIKIKNQSNSMKSRKVLEAETRETGLNQAIGASNKGFSLLSKMGYKPGMAIGKKGDGRSEPVPIELPQGRSGLGLVAEKRKQQDKVAAMRVLMMAKRKKNMENQQSSFRSYHSNKHTEKQIEQDLAKSQRVCEQLDIEQGDCEPLESFFWPDRVEQGCDDLGEEEDKVIEEEEEETQPEEEHETRTSREKLEMLTEYLRSHYFYCVWCGTKYDDTADMGEHCPGDTADDHD